MSKKQKAVQACKHVGARSRKGFVWLITREKFIQGGITSLLFGIITSASEGVGILLQSQVSQTIGVSVPAKWLMIPILVALLSVFIWADNNTNEWRKIIQETTGEDVNNE